IFIQIMYNLRLAEFDQGARLLSSGVVVEQIDQILSERHDVVIAVLLEVGIGQLVEACLGGVRKVVHRRLLAELLEVLDEILADLAEHSIEDVVLASLGEGVVVRLDKRTLGELVLLDLLGIGLLDLLDGSENGGGRCSSHNGEEDNSRSHGDRRDWGSQ
ncbi:hypothetical protein PMAYCL1PPCAC_15566, partial [Pristionchus mayeri]